MTKIRIGIIGYGNLGRGIELAIAQNPDMVLKAIFTRRDPQNVQPVKATTPVLPYNEAVKMQKEIDVMILCGGSASDLPQQTPYFAQYFNVVDSFDTHAKIPEHFAAVEQIAKAHDKVAIISVGWDPGMFSLNRLYAQSILPEGADYTFWGKGVSQGHSDAIRRVAGVKDGKQYTIPIDKAIEAVRSGDQPTFTTREKHLRECYVVAHEGADLAEIESTIKNMPNYFADYDTVVHFVSQEVLDAEHNGIPHGGFVIRSGKTGEFKEHNHIIEYSLKLDSNPEFTASVLVAYARAAYRLNQIKHNGAKTVFDIPPAMLSPLTAEQLRKDLL